MESERKKNAAAPNNKLRRARRLKPRISRKAGGMVISVPKSPSWIENALASRSNEFKGGL
jgi:hypothetical protein